MRISVSNRGPDDGETEARVEQARLAVLREEAERRRLRQDAQRPRDASREKRASLTTTHVLTLLVVILLGLVILKLSAKAMRMGGGQRAASALAA